MCCVERLRKATRGGAMLRMVRLGNPRGLRAMTAALVTHFGEHAEWTGVSNDDRPRWLLARRELLTASDTAAIIGEDPHRSALDVWLDKVGEAENDTALDLDDPRFWGSILEQPILRAVAAFHSWDYHPGGALLRARKHPWIGSTLDAEIDRHDGLGWIPNEGKTTRIEQGWSEEEGDLPTRVLIQVQHQLLVTGAPLALVFALLQGSRPVRIEVHPSPTFFSVIVEETERFRERLATGDRPPPDGSEASRRALARIYPKDGGHGVILPESALEWTREIKAITEQMKALERRKEELKNLLRDSIGGATYGVFPGVGPDGQRAWKHALERRPEHVVSASESRVLRAIKKLPPIPIMTSVGEPVHARVSLRDFEELLANSSFAPGSAEECRAHHEKIRFAKRRRARR